MSKTDKYQHGLIAFYLKEFKALKNKKISFLELGVFKGDSLKVWGKFFKNGRIYGLDGWIPPVKFPPNVKTFQGAQENIPFIDEIGKQAGPFDIILDDCSHEYAPTAISHNTLYPYLKPGGLYIIEDWTAGFIKTKKFYGLQKLILELVERRDFQEMRIIKLPQGGSTILIKK